MTDRDKLKHLLKSSPHLDTLDCSFDEAVDWLLKYGVTVPVRCKNCKHCEHINDEFDKDWWQCKRRGNSFQRKPNDYCSYGELKEREGK